MRVLFQGLTVAGIIIGSYYVKQRDEARQQESRVLDQERERAEFQERMRAAEEAHAYENAMAKPKEDERGIFEKLGLGRGSLKSREAAVKAAAAVPPSSSVVVEPPPPAVVAPTTATSPITASAATASSGGWSNWFGFGSSPRRTDSDSETKN